MNQFHRNRPQQRGIDSHTSRHKPGALDKIVSLTKLLYKPGHILYAVLVVAIDGNHPLIAPLHGPPNAHPQLRPLLSFILVHQQGVDIQRFQCLFCGRAILGAAVADDNIHVVSHMVLLRPPQLLVDAVPLVDNGDKQHKVFGFRAIFLRFKPGNPRLFFVRHRSSNPHT